MPNRFLYYDPEVSLTTIDNPYDPREDYNKWLMWDELNGYNTQNYIARLMGASVDALEDELIMLRDRAISEIIDADTYSTYYVLKPNEKRKFPLKDYI